MQVASAQGWECQECHKDVSQNLEFEIDHIYAFSRGGSNHRLNLQPLCLQCHAQKTKKDRQPIFRDIKKEIYTN
jgi:5-methylcytosine-specific restriction endonuclease McrA